ncbi:hypothetical protein CQA62_05400 [Helicobacter cholecystus]|uniref:Transglycosylase SLT domain-containing protein n=1 Tax=Helicobacter cholecystus TaxID=45498 RepID=A0A3D8IUZ1_9HELI|nr:hypothetical protein [Helicobacter cholecystus]RDU68823.1 hypothetical protein CQA62_05400 [Helicobacter cholecystus]
MKKILLFSCILCGFLVLYANTDDPCINIQKFDKDQLQTIRYAYHYGKNHDLGYTMAAIAWKESCAGLYRINFDDPSAGIYHAYLPNVIKRHYKKQNTSFRRNMVAERLIRDLEFASQIALEELLYWKKIRKNNWKAMIKSYNKGFSWEKNRTRNQMAQNYYEDIAKKIEILQNYFEKNPQMLQPIKNLKKPNFTQSIEQIRLLSEH